MPEDDVATTDEALADTLADALHIPQAVAHAAAWIDRHPAIARALDATARRRTRH